MEIGTLPGKTSFAPFNTECTCFYSLLETLNPYISAGCNLKTNCRLNLLLVFPPYIPEKYPVVTEKSYRKLFPPIWKSGQPLILREQHKHSGFSGILLCRFREYLPETGMKYPLPGTIFCFLVQNIHGMLCHKGMR